MEHHGSGFVASPWAAVLGHHSMASDAGFAAAAAAAHVPEPLDAPSYTLASPPPLALASTPTSALASAPPSAPGNRRRDADGSACAAGIPLLQVN